MSTVNAVVGSNINPASASDKTPLEMARDILAANTGRSGVNYGEVQRSLDILTKENPTLGAAVEKEVATILKPVGYGKMLSASYNVKAEDGRMISISRNAPSLESYYNGTAHAGKAKTPAERTAYRASDLAHYARLDKMFGDGNPKTFEKAKIDAGIDEAIRSSVSYEQAAKNIAARETAAANADSLASSELAQDLGQMALDIVGIFDPTPTADLVNAAWSAWRGDGWGAFLSAVSAVPYIGDAAKLGKLGKWAETVANAVEMAAKNPAMRAALEPSLRKISDLVGSLPAKGLDALPTSAKEALLNMKSKIDDLIGAGGKKVDGTNGQFSGKVRGEKILLEGIETKSVNYVKRDRTEYAELRVRTH
jgi:hypothetical protein